MTLSKAAQETLETLERMHPGSTKHGTFAALRTALGAPVAWLYYDPTRKGDVVSLRPLLLPAERPLYD